MGIRFVAYQNQWISHNENFNGLLDKIYFVSIRKIKQKQK